MTQEVFNEGVETDMEIDVGDDLVLKGKIGPLEVDCSIPLEQSWAWIGAVEWILIKVRNEVGKRIILEALGERDTLSMREALKLDKARWTARSLASCFQALLEERSVTLVSEDYKNGPVIRRCSS